MKKPNLFVIGAPKCGTTTLASWLGSNPDVYMSKNKEPNYFNTDMYAPDRYNEDEYLNLFKESNHNRYLGEASTRYLYSKKACSNILSYSPESKFIAIVRNPVDMIYSLHNHLVFLGVEPVKSFRRAWGVNENRTLGDSIPVDCSDPDSLVYSKIGLLGEQIEHFFSIVPEAQRLTLCFDDLVENPEAVYHRVILFLEIEGDSGVDFSATNKSMAHMYEWLNKMVRWLASKKEVIGIKKGMGLLNFINKVNRTEKSRKLLPDDLRCEIAEYFHSDVVKLERLLERDLSHWIER